MTTVTRTLSFRVEESVAAALDAEAQASGQTRSDLLVQAAKDLLYRRMCEHDAAIYAADPLTDDEAGAWPSSTWGDDNDDDWDGVFE